MAIKTLFLAELTQMMYQHSLQKNLLRSWEEKEERNIEDIVKSKTKILMKIFLQENEEKLSTWMSSLDLNYVKTLMATRWHQEWVNFISYFRFPLPVEILVESLLSDPKINPKVIFITHHENYLGWFI